MNHAPAVTPDIKRSFRLLTTSMDFLFSTGRKEAIQVSDVGDIMKWFSKVRFKKVQRFKAQRLLENMYFSFSAQGVNSPVGGAGIWTTTMTFLPRGPAPSEMQTAATYGRHYLSQTGGRLAALTNFWSQREFCAIYTLEISPDQITSYMESNVSSLLQRKLLCFHGPTQQCCYGKHQK